jgi:hypothetical protein
VEVVAEMRAEEDVHERRPEFAHSDVRFTAQVDRLQRLEEPPSGPIPNLAVLQGR